MNENTDNQGRPAGPPKPPPFNLPPKPPGFGRVDDSPTRLIERRPAGGRRTSPWLWVGLGLLVAAIAAVTVLWFVFKSGDRSYDYSDGENPQVEQEIISSDLTDAQEEVEVSVEESAVPGLLTGHVYLDGEIAGFPFTVDMDIMPDGTATGTYWNVLYDLKFRVSGTRDDRNGLTLDLSRDGVHTTLRLAADGGGRYSGTWGKKHQPVEARLEKGPRPGGSVSPADARKVRISGNGIRSLAYISDDYLWYADQGSGPGHRLRVRHLDGFTYEILSDMGSQLATFDLIETQYGISGTLHDRSGKTFEIIGE